MQGWQSQSGRPSNCQTNVLTETVSPTGKKHAYHSHRFMPARTSPSELKKELWRPENESILSVVGTNWLALLGIGSRLNAKQNFDRFSCTASSCDSPGVPETACGRESNQNSVSYARTKVKTSSGVLSSKLQKLPLSQTIAILLLPGCYANIFSYASTLLLFLEHNSSS